MEHPRIRILWVRMLREGLGAWSVTAVVVGVVVVLWVMYVSIIVILIGMGEIVIVRVHVFSIPTTAFAFY